MTGYPSYGVEALGAVVPVASPPGLRTARHGRFARNASGDEHA